METAAAAVRSLLPKLQAYLLLKQTDDHHDAELLSRELTNIHAALHDAAARAHGSPEQQPHGGDQGRAWAGAARELAYDVGNAIDDLFVTSSLPPARAQDDGDRVHGLPPGSPFSLKELLQRAADLSASRPQTAGEAPVPPATVGHPAHYRQPPPDADDEVVLVGADAARDGLIRRLRLRDEGDRDDGEVVDDSDRKVKAVAVVGCLGLGKTALARAAYGVLRAQFDCTAFVSVGFHPHIESVLLRLLRLLGFADDDPATEEKESRVEKQLISQLRGFLENKRYLIVVDDLWDKPSWEKIRCALVDNNRGSRIIATTRNFDVADQVGIPYELKPLSAENSRTLFFRTIFGHEDKRCSDDEFAKVADKILNKCGGVPLAIVTVGKLVASKLGDKGEWHKVQNLVPIGPGLENTPDVKNMRTVTSRGYYNPPPCRRITGGSPPRGSLRW